MLKMKELNIDDIHRILLDMAKSIHRICEENGLTYYLAYGSLLGAVRHKGFIPWDDDLDIYVPVNQYNNFIYVMEKKLSPPYYCSTYKSNEACVTPYAKIENRQTCIHDLRSKLPLEKQMGINIDVFPLMYCDKKETAIKVRRLLLFKRTLFTENADGNRWKGYMKSLLRLIYWKKESDLSDKFWDIVNSSRGSKYLVSFGAMDDRDFLSPDIFGIPVLVDFENTKLNGIAKPHEYLSQMYGDYMNPVPRPPHATGVYLKDDC